MSAAIAKKQLESVLANRFGNAFERRVQRLPECVPTGLGELDKSLQGFPRGGITEIHGSASSGRTTMLLSALAVATSQEETCALVDCSDTFDVASASKRGVDFDRLLWVRCNDNLERAFKAVDLLLHGGGFGLVALNLTDVPAKSARRIISSWWFRFRRAIENTQTALLVLTSVTCVRSAATVVLELKNEAATWVNTRALVPVKGDGERPGKQNQTTRLSLVSAPPLQPFFSSIPPHTHFLQGGRVSLNRQRPVAWSSAALRFNSRLH